MSQEDDKGNDEVEEDGLSEVNIRMDVDGVDLVHWNRAQSKRTNLASKPADWRTLMGRTKRRDETDVSVDLSSGSLHMV